MRHLVFLFIICLVLLSACRSVKYVPVERTVTETVRTVDTVVEIKLEVQRDSVAVSGDTVSFLKNEYCYSYASYSGGVLHHSLVVWPKTLLIEVPKTVVERQVTEPKVVEVEKKRSLWERAEEGFLKFYFIGSLIAMIIYYVIKLTKKKDE